MSSIRASLRDWYNRTYRFNSYNRRQWVATQASRIPPGARVLDVGAGTGLYRSLFSHCDYRTHDFGQVPRLVGSYTQLDYVSDIESIPVLDESFDVILCTEVLEHVPEPIKVLQEMARILRSQGELWLTAPLGSHLHQEPYHFYGGFTPYWYRMFLPTVGFEIQSIDANGGFFSFFGQEVIRFNVSIHPRQTRTRGFFVGLILTSLWLLTTPTFWLMPLLGRPLDALGLERFTTVGYHIVAIKGTRNAEG